ncbi:MAG: hypothetical protein K8T90_15210 [Planctomycetes bacterium]|nr:hypothetical protein [Planctomycetota bacterium]
MGFSTMKESDCLVRKALGQFKWADAEALVGTQTLATGAKSAVQTAASEAGDAKLVKPVAKVGLVGKNLVFRIKHEGGHHGKADILIVKNYVRAAPDTGAVKKAMLKSSKQKDLLSVAWWNDVRGDLDPGELGAALADYAKGIQGLTGKETSQQLEQLADDLVGSIESAIGGLRSKLGHKDDQGLLGRVENAASQAREEFAGRRVEAEKRFADAAKVAVSIVADRTKKILLAITKAEKTIESGDTAAAYRDYTLVKQICVKEDADSTIVPASSSNTSVDSAAVLDVVKKSAAADDLRKLFTALPTKCRNLLTQIEKLEEGKDLDSDHPERTSSQVFGYRNDLVAINAEYKKVLTTIDNARKTAIGRLQIAKKFHQGVSGLKAWDDRVSDGVVSDVNGMAKLMEETVKVYSGIRSESGDVKKWVAGAKITAPDIAKFLTPILNKCMATWYGYRDAETAYLDEVEAIAGTAETKFGGAATEGVKAIRAAVALRRKAG